MEIAELKDHIDRRFEDISSDMKDMRLDIKTMTKEVLCQNEKITECKKDIQHTTEEIIEHKIETKKEFDKVWSKNRSQDTLISGINNRVMFFAGGIGVAAFIIGIVVAIVKG